MNFSNHKTAKILSSLIIASVHTGAETAEIAVAAKGTQQKEQMHKHQQWPPGPHHHL